MADITVELEDARIVFRNFTGEARQYNNAGDRNFSIVLNNETAESLKAEGWNVKTKPAREEGDEPFHHLPVSVNFNGRTPPRIVMITSRGRTMLDEDTCGVIDWAEIESCDIIIRAYDWSVNGKTGRKAYLKKIFVIIHEDKFEQKYAHVPDEGQLAIENVIEAEVSEDSGWSTEVDEDMQIMDGIEQREVRSRKALGR